MLFTVYTAGCTGNPKNRIYPNRVEVSDAGGLQNAVMRDHVCAEYTGNARSKEGFLRADVIVLDVDNDHTENPEEWITSGTMERLFGDVNYMLATSRNHGKQKGSYSPRPRFHVYFPIREVTEADRYTALKEDLAARFRFFDENALDAARFIFGCRARVICHEGSMNVDAWLRNGANGPAVSCEISGQAADGIYTMEDIATAVERGILPEGYIIPEGQRNKTMHGIAIRILTRYGNSALSHQSYLKEARRCYPPLPDTEMQEIWQSASNHYEEVIKNSPGYILPPDFEKQLYGASQKRHRKGDAMTTDSGVAADSPCVGTSPRQLPAGRANSPDGSDSALCDRYIGEAPAHAGSYADSDGITSYDSQAATEPDYIPRLKPRRFTDQDQADMVVMEMGRELLYNDAMGFMRYDGTIWKSVNMSAFQGLMEFMNRQVEDAEAEYAYCRRRMEALGIPPDLYDRNGLRKSALIGEEREAVVTRYEEAKKYLRFALDYRSHRGKLNIQSDVMPLVTRPVESMDWDGRLLNCPEATWNVELGMDGRQQHDPDDSITNVTMCDPGDRGADLWEDALNTFFCNDRELINYVQEIVGEALLGKVENERMIIAYGGGRNGKSTFWNAIAKVLGTYSGRLSTDALSPYCRRNIKPEMAELRGKRLVIASELEAGATLSTSVLKQLCSTDPIYAEKKYMSPFFFEPSHTLVLCTNYLPRVQASDKGTWRRFVVIPFQAVIQPRTDILNYGDYLAEHAGPAILKWAMEGAGRSAAGGYHAEMPEAVLKITGEFRAGNDKMSGFLEECCYLGEGLTAPSGELYRVYREYCMRNGERALGTGDFYRELKNRGLEKMRTKRGVIVMGLELIAEAVAI